MIIFHIETRRRLRCCSEPWTGFRLLPWDRKNKKDRTGLVFSVILDTLIISQAPLLSQDVIYCALTVVTTVMSNFGLYKAFDEKGIGYAKTAVGDKYVYEYMAKNGCRIGGEQSGHIIFSKYASTGDGILTSLKMMEVMLAKKKPMSELAAPLKIYPQVLENIRVTDKKAAQNDPAVQEAVSKVAEALGDTGRILVRESGTEPVVRVMVEAPDHDTCQKYVDEVVNVICEKGYKA